MITIRTAATKASFIFLAIIYLASFLLSIIAYAIDNRPMYALFKSLVVPSIMAYTYLAWVGPRTRHYTLLQLAFAFAWVGDVLIALPKTYPVFLFVGGWFFFFQHIFYISLHLTAKNCSANLWKTPYWGLPTIAYVALFSIAYWARGNLWDKIQFSGYSFILGTSFYTSFYRETKARRGYITCILGFAFFVISDIILLLDNFVFTMTDLQASTVLLTYYIAQSLISYTHVCLLYTSDAADE
eukprot:TRINITY_DN5887_c0_g1_i8.p1 TRINITY_DN5887_c0_g1~~TRINITY_DN5887_c0_g1_i8.p1  ORF type:complete len:241 (+),score=39.78 TRINITY_DN5887_c0_g1_i8:162-884(+)